MAKQLSEILMEQGTLTAEQVKRAQLYSKQNNVSVAEAIIKFGFASEEKVTAALAKHFAVPYIHTNMSDGSTGIIRTCKKDKIPWLQFLRCYFL